MEETQLELSAMADNGTSVNGTDNGINTKERDSFTSWIISTTKNAGIYRMKIF